MGVFVDLTKACHFLSADLMENMAKCWDCQENTRCHSFLYKNMKTPVLSKESQTESLTLKRAQKRIMVWYDDYLQYAGLKLNLRQ